MNSFINRTISGALMLVISFICIYIKGSALIAYSIAIALLCLVELFKTFKLNDILIECTSILFSIVVLYFIGTSNKNLVLTSFSLYFLVVSISIMGCFLYFLGYRYICLFIWHDIWET